MADVLSDRDKVLQLLQSGAFEEASAAIISALETNPEDIELHLLLGYAYSRLDKLDESINILEKAADIAPNSAKVHYNLGVAYQRADNPTQAKDEYLRALGIDPGYEAPRKALDSLKNI